MNTGTSIGVEEALVDCTCKSWGIGNAQLFSFTMLAALHGMKYTGEKWKYCPWCGKKFELETSAKQTTVTGTRRKD